MQLARLEVDRLFARYTHTIDFPTRPEEEGTAGEPSLTILHGPNGVGKTTLLRMLDGILRLDFNTFRRVPFALCTLRFSTGDFIEVQPSEGPDAPLSVRFHGETAHLSPSQQGPFSPQDNFATEQLREAFFKFTEGIAFDLISTRRIAPEPDAEFEMVQDIDGAVYPRPTRRRASGDKPPLAMKVARFMRDAQVNYRRFFGAERELFPRIMELLTTGAVPSHTSIDTLQERLMAVSRQAEVSQRLGLETEPWDFDELIGYLNSLEISARHEPALTVLGAYIDFLESRAAQRELVVERLTTFEKVMNDFLLDKSLHVDGHRGLIITAEDGTQLVETQLSSGEHHLLYLMVASLTTQRRGTVIAIDEPELSLHIAWQRMLIRRLVECASNASPQFVFATHSPEIIADYRDYLVPMAP